MLKGVQPAEVAAVAVGPQRVSVPSAVASRIWMRREGIGVPVVVVVARGVCYVSLISYVSRGWEGGEGGRV